MEKVHHVGERMESKIATEMQLSKQDEMKIVYCTFMPILLYAYVLNICKVSKWKLLISIHVSFYAAATSLQHPWAFHFNREHLGQSP